MRNVREMIATVVESATAMADGVSSLAASSEHIGQSIDETSRSTWR